MKSETKNPKLDKVWRVVDLADAGDLIVLPDACKKSLVYETVTGKREVA